MDDKVSAGDDEPQEVVVEVQPTLQDDVAAQQAMLGSAEERPETQPQQRAVDGEADSEELEKPEKSISRAERRRRIKEEIRKLSEGQERGYYQRRLW